jgi:hypothetical protein
MFVFGLVHDRGWEQPPEEDVPAPRPERSWRLPWRPLAWVAAWCWLMALVPVVSDAFGGFAGFGVLMLAVALGFWRLERLCVRQYWHGLREYKL